MKRPMSRDVSVFMGSAFKILMNIHLNDLSDELKYILNISLMSNCLFKRSIFKIHSFMNL